MAIDQTLKRLLAEELCAIVAGWDQYHAAALLGLRQPQVSALRHGRTGGFSSDRLVRLIASQGYNVEIVVREMPRRFAQPRVEPTVTVQRFDSLGRAVARPAPGPVKRVKRWSGEVDARAVARIEQQRPRRSEGQDIGFDMDDD